MELSLDNIIFTNVLNASFDTIPEEKCGKANLFVLERKTYKARFVRFVIESFHGAGPALGFFQPLIPGENIILCTIIMRPAFHVILLQINRHDLHRGGGEPRRFLQLECQLGHRRRV